MLLSVADKGEVSEEEKEETATTRTFGWERYRDPATEVDYWWNERTHKWFFVTDRSWRRHQCGDTKKFWWWNAAAGSFFMEGE